VSSDICVIIPAYNASKTIGAVVTAALRHISKIIVADDGSSDTTGEAAAAAGAEVIVIEKNSGKGHALKLLFQRALEEGYSAVISMDADGQHDPEEIPKFMAAHNAFRDSIIVGTRMHEKEKIPRGRYNSMRIARFYVSLVANQFVEDTQCGFRLYPLSVIGKMRLLTERYVLETELLMKAGDMGVNIRFVNIKTIYGENGSHFRPIADIVNITAYVISYVHVKWLIEGVTSNNPNTYSAGFHLRDAISRSRVLDVLFQTLTVFTALPASLFYLMEYLLLPPLIPYNFASIRKLGCGFATITLATHMLPVVLIVGIVEKTGHAAGLKLNLLDKFIERFYPHIWPD
jgi:glycosyltransferase involved in cell wall biosynthesis